MFRYALLRNSAVIIPNNKYMTNKLKKPPVLLGELVWVAAGEAGGAAAGSIAAG